MQRRGGGGISKIAHATERGRRDIDARGNAQSSHDRDEAELGAVLDGDGEARGMEELDRLKGSEGSRAGGCLEGCSCDSVVGNRNEKGRGSTAASWPRCTEDSAWCRNTGRLILGDAESAGAANERASSRRRRRRRRGGGVCVEVGIPRADTPTTHTLPAPPPRSSARRERRQ